MAYDSEIVSALVDQPDRKYQPKSSAISNLLYGARVPPAGAPCRNYTCIAASTKLLLDFP